MFQNKVGLFCSSRRRHTRFDCDWSSDVCSSDLDGRTEWTGVRNPVAQKHLQSMRKGDRIFFYHTGDVKAVVGIAQAASAPYPDPSDKKIGRASCRERV